MTDLREHRFYHKRSYCLFCTQEVEYLPKGHLLTPHGMQVNPKKIEAIINWPTPTNVSKLRLLVVILQYYDGFIDHFAQIAFPLTKLIKKDTPWESSHAQETAFSQLQRAVSPPPCLLLPHLAMPFVVRVDASRYALEAELQQDQRRELQPVAFESRKLQPPKHNLPCTSEL